ncbi:hypothetical protein PTKIN_Ptkin08bG0032700 [Pterospermum kingtungense]
MFQNLCKDFLLLFSKAKENPFGSSFPGDKMEAFEKPSETQSGDQSLDLEAKEGSKAAAVAACTVEKSWENGVRVSTDANEGPCLDEDGKGLEGSEMNGVSSLLQMKESCNNVDVNGGSESVKGYGTLLGNKSKEIGAEKVFPSGDDGVSLVDIHGKAAADEEDDDDGDGDGDLGCEFSAGDFVWGKIRSHPWWPGQVYSPSDASDYAVKVRQKGRFLLVAYFGDGSFTWCHPSQLKPFEENFEDMLNLSNSHNFLNALHASVDEIGRLVELKMTCSCVSEANCSGIDRPLGENAGIKEGVVVPDGGIRKLSIEPEEILGKLKQCAQAVSMSNMLECRVLKGWLSAFNRSMGRYQMQISELEDNAISLVVDMSEYNEAVAAPIRGPVEEEWISYCGGPKYGQCSQTLLRCMEISENGMYQKRKQKSLSEIIKGELDFVPLKGTNSDEQASSYRRRKTKGNNKGNVDDGSGSSSIPRKRKETELSGPITGRKGKRSSVETGVIGAKEEMGKGYSSRASNNDNDDSGGREDNNGQTVSAKRKVNVGSGIANSDAETKDLIESGSLLRKRKKSKYLSPPYTSLRKWDIEAESLKVSTDNQLGEHMSKGSGNLVRSPLVLSCGDEGNQLYEEVHAEQACFRTSRWIIDLEKVKTPANEVLIEVRSVALSPQYQTKNKTFGIVVEFLSAFRSCVYQDGSNYKIYEETSMDQSKHRQATSALLKKRSEESKAYNPKIKQAAREIVTKKNDKEVVEQASTAILFVTFGPGSSLPTKDDLIRIYSEYGALDTEETDMYYNSFCARVVFLRSSDAEQAFNCSQSDSPFGASNVSFRLRLLSAASAREHREIPTAKPSPLAKGGARRSENSSASQYSADQTSQLTDIRSKLELLISMLDISDEKMSSGTKSQVQSEIKGLLEKVNTMIDSSS